MRRIALFPLIFAILASGPAVAEKPHKPEALKPGLYAVFDTSEGTIIAQLYEKDVPVAVKTFVGLALGTIPWREPHTGKLVKGPLYNGITFHRIIREEMIQTGDPTGIGTHDCGIRLQDEFLPGIQFSRPGRLAVANTGGPNSGGCQFFFTEQAVPRWNNQYTIFGQVVEGQDVIHTIDFKKLVDDKPVVPVLLKSVTIRRVAAAQQTR